jgi:hypothetical protein
MEEIREKMLRELKEFLTANKITALIKIDHPVGGSVIKLNGVALYKILKTPNPFKNNGIAVHRNLSDHAISTIGGKRAKGKNAWIAAPLTDFNYDSVFTILTKIALSANSSRNKQMSTFKTAIIKSQKEKKAKETKPKKKRTKLTNSKVSDLEEGLPVS